jgi:hypothetical protein
MDSIVSLLFAIAISVAGNPPQSQSHRQKTTTDAGQCLTPASPCTPVWLHKTHCRQLSRHLVLCSLPVYLAEVGFHL